MDDGLELVGTATTVLRIGPHTILTDPNFLHRGQRAHLGKALSSKRLTEPSLHPADLPATPPVMGSVLERDGFRVYVTGDTLCYPWLGEVADRCGPLDKMVVHLGGTRVLGLLVTMDAAQGADLVELVRPGVTVPVHHDDHRLFRSPLTDFLSACRERGAPTQVRPVPRGGAVSLVPAPA